MGVLHQLAARDALLHCGGVLPRQLSFDRLDSRRVGFKAVRQKPRPFALHLSLCRLQNELAYRGLVNLLSAALHGQQHAADR